MAGAKSLTGEEVRLRQDQDREKNWKRWGPYLSERQWGTVREDYSPDSDSWNSFPHDHARSRAYRWGEDGLLGWCDRECRLCFALALWNEQDSILKERLFGLSGPEGNHGEDVKECYYYLDSTPTHSYCRALYKYPQLQFPYEQLIEENRRRGVNAPEFELHDTGIFSDNRYFDVQIEYAKAAPNDILIRLKITNRGPQQQSLRVLPTLWFRNTWEWGCRHEGCTMKPKIDLNADGVLQTRHETLEPFRFAYDLNELSQALPEVLFTDNATNSERLTSTANTTRYVKDAFHDYVIHGNREAVNPGRFGTKAAPLYNLVIPPGQSVVIRLRLSAESELPKTFFGAEFDGIIDECRKGADQFYQKIIPAGANAEQRHVMRQAYAGLAWSKQFYHYIVDDWLNGDPNLELPSAKRKAGRNHEWKTLYSRDVISMPDKWEYPWFAAWDLAFHMLPFCRIDPAFAKHQLELFLREWYMHPNGQLPAYEYNFSDTNPPVHAWAAWRVYKMSAQRGKRDRRFLESVFQKLLLNFTWWVNRKDIDGNNLFAGGFLGLDNIGVFDRSQALPTGGHLEQADGTAWMAFYCLTMLAIALELAKENAVYEDMASKFFEHFVSISDAMNSFGGAGLWDEEDGFYYDQLKSDGQNIKLKSRSMVGLLPLIAVEVLDEAVIQKFPSFMKRMNWFMEHRSDLARNISFCNACPGESKRLLAICSRERLERTLRYLLDESEFLSPYGIRSVSRVHADKPYVFRADAEEFKVDYVPGEGNSYAFGGNSNWRGPIWFPINYLIVEALERFHYFFGDTLLVEYPTGSGRRLNLKQVADELSRRLGSIFLKDQVSQRPCFGDDLHYATDPHWKELVLFHEYFHGESGRGLGASHQTGWTALVTNFLENSISKR
ncbi:glucosidase [Oligoflexia bacterium]|nr:glucosidase [Oligoflexia bacterium]